MAARAAAGYRWAGAALLRASTDPGGVELPEDLDLFGEDSAQPGLAWLSAMWQREEVRAALGAASPALFRQIDALVALGSRDARMVRRAVISLASYVLRWQQRPTPFGLFAGVGLARIEVSVLHSRPVHAALKAAGEPVKFGELRKLLIHQFPAAAAGQIDGLLAGLLDHRMLISSLWAPMTCPDALGHACAEREAADAHTLPEVKDMVRELSAIHQELSTDSPAIAPRSAVTERMRALSEAADVPLVVDTILDCDVQIPEHVAQEARDAVRVLYRLSPYPFGYPA